MPFNSILAVVMDIRYQIDLIADFTKGMDYESFSKDMRTIYAVTRCLEIISEASRRLPDSMKERHPSIEWRQMAGAGNIYRHDYEDVSCHHIWDTVNIALPPLSAVIDRELHSIV